MTASDPMSTHATSFADAAAEANLKVTTHRWLQGDPIPYDEMRRLCGLPDVSVYIARRDAELAWRRMTAAFTAFGEGLVLVYKEVEQAAEPLRQFAAAFQQKQKHKPPMWAFDPSHSPRTRNRATDIRTPFR